MSIEPLGPGPGIVVELSWSEVLLAAQAGIMRRVNALKYRRRDSFGHDRNPARIWGGDIDGAIAELGLAKYLGVFWSGTVGRVDLLDVGPYQVRSKLRPDHRLIVVPDDDDEEAFISVLVTPPSVTLCGWLLGWEAKQPEWWVEDPRRTPEPAFYVPNSELHAIRDLNPSAGRGRSRLSAG